MPKRLWLLVVAVVLCVASGSAGARGSLHHRSAADLRPRAFASCAELVRYARHALGVTHGLSEPAVVPLAESSPGRQTPAAGAPSGGSQGSTSFSTTNNQEAGIDEPDLVKTDGSTIFVVSQGALYAVEVDHGTPRLVGSLSLASVGNGAQLLLRGSRLIVISGGGFPVPVGTGVGAQRGAAFAPYYYGGRTVVTEVDVHKPAAMIVTRTLTIDGALVDARQNGASARLVISSTPSAIAYRGLRAEASGWVPMMRFHSRLTGRRYTRPVAACRTIRRAADFSGLGMLTILTINLDHGLYATDSQALMADARVVYGSRDSLYVATEKWVDPRTPVDRLRQSQSTVIDRFDAADPQHTRFVSSGEVPGYVLNQFSLSEQAGYLRVATTSRPIWWGTEPPQTLSQSYVTVLASQGGLLVPVGQVSGLGVGQQIYSVRFLGDAGYVVTYRQVDPLYTVDLSDPTAPRVAGKLELDGYSSYLHPVGNGLLLGIGQDVGATNEPVGSQLELFDVSHPSAPKLLDRTSLGSGSSSEAQYDHHAFLFWPPTHLAVLPVQIYPVVQPGGPVTARSGGVGVSSGTGISSSRAGSSAQAFVGAIGLHIDPSRIAEVGRIAHDPIQGYSPPIRRSLVIGDELFTVSDGGVMASSLDTLARRGFVAFPQPMSSGGSGPPTLLQKP